MNIKIVTLLGLLLGINAFAGDTPFLVFECDYSLPSEDYTFELKFHNDNQQEELDWSSPWNRSTVEFEKQNLDTVRIHITTGLPLLAHAAPKEFRFSAPLSTGQFDFAMGVDPLTIRGGDMLNLTCTKKKPEQP